MRARLVGLAAASAWAAWAALLAPGLAAAQAPRTAYALEAQLDPVRHRVAGHAVIDFVNSAAVPVRELLFHLYPNAFANGDTVFAREGGFVLRGLRMQRHGSLQLRSLTTDAGADLLAGAETELVEGDETQLRVRLPAALEPGARLGVRARFEVQLPSLVARMGQAAAGGSDFNMIAQWYPKLAKLMPDGSWRSTPYHGAGEFDADFADFELTVHVPEPYVVAAPGVRAASCVARAALRCERYTHHDVLDVAWTAATDLQRIEHRRDGSAITVEVYAPRGARALAQRQAELAARALDELGAQLGPYPHARFVIVIPPPFAVGAAGMEYPGLVVGWTAHAWATLLPAASQHDVVTAHEVAHQWFPMIVASDEVHDPVLDEGLAEWLGLHVLRDRYGHASEWSLLGLTASQLTGVPLDAFDIAAATLGMRTNAPSSWKSAPEVGLGDLAESMYLRPAVALETLAKQKGRDRLLRALGAYARAHRFRHVTPADLTRALDAEYGAGFGERVFVPALAGKDSALTRREPAPHERDAARAVPSRLIALIQLALGWIAP